MSSAHFESKGINVWRLFLDEFVCVLYTSYGCLIVVDLRGFIEGHFLKDSHFVPAGFRHCCGYAEGLSYFLLLLFTTSLTCCTY